MSGWWDDIDPVEPLPEPVMIHAEVAQYSARISRRILVDPTVAPYRVEMIRRATEDAILQVERYVYSTVVDPGRQDVPFEVTVPWRTTVTVPRRLTWWDRLRGKRPEPWTRTIAGTVTARGTVQVTNTARIRWPDVRTDDPRGRPIQYVDGPAFDRARVESYSVHPGVPHGEGPVVAGQAVESRVYVRCPIEDGGCGHHWSSHQDPAFGGPIGRYFGGDVGQMFTGCSIDGCDCRRRPPHGGVTE